MANSDKNIVITPNRSSSTDQPKIAFTGQGNSTVTLRVLDDANNTLSFEGNVGQLFSISNSLTGNIFSVNDISGIPSVRVNSDGNVFLAELGGNVGVGNVAPTHKLSVTGTMNVSGNANVGNLGTAALVMTGALSGVTTLSVTGNANVGNIGATRGVFTNISGTLETAAQTNITSVGTLTSLAVTGNITSGNVSGTRGAFTNISGTLETAAQTNITSVGTLGTLTVSGNAAFDTNTLFVDSVANEVGIGTTSPSERLEVVGNLYVNGEGSGLIIDSGGAKRVGLMKYGGQEGLISRIAAQDFGIVRTGGSNIFDGSSLTFDLYVDGNGNIGIGNTAPTHKLSVTGTANISGNLTAANLITGNLTLGSDALTSSHHTITLDPSTAGAGGNVIIQGNLQVTGTTTTVNSTTVEVTDLNLTLAKDAVNAAAANGAGLTVAGASATMTYASTGDKWTFNKPLDVTGSLTASTTLNVTGNANVGNLGAAAGVFSGTLSVTGNSTQGNITTGNTITYGQFGTPIKLRVLTDNSLSFEGSSGQLFTINDSLTGDIFNVNDITGLPSIRVNSNGNVFLAEYNGNVGIGNVAPAHKLSVTGTMNVSGNANVGNLGAAAGVFSGNITAGNINSVSGILSVTGNANVGNIGATRGVFTNVAGTLETASQTNITSVGTLGALSVTGNAGVGNLNLSGNIVDTGALALITAASGNISLAPNGSTVLVTTTTGANVTGTLNATGNANVGNIGATRGVFTNIAGTLETAAQTNITSVGTLGSLAVTGNITSGNVSGTRGAFTNIAGTLETASQTNITSVGTLGALSVTGNANVGNIGATRGVFTNISGTLETAAQTNITSLGTLTSLTVSGNATFDTNTLFVDSVNNEVGIGTSSPLAILNTNAGTITGPAVTPGLMLTSLYSGVTAVNSIDWNYSGQSTSPVRLGATFNSGGAGMEMVFYTSTSYTTTGSERMRINMDGNVGVGNSAPAHTLRVEGTLSATGNANVGNLGTSGNITANYFFGNGSQLTGITAAPSPTVANGTSNLVVTANGNVTTSVAGTANVLVVTSTGANVAGTLNVTGASYLATSSGNVGIGTTSPNAKLQVVGNIQVGNNTADWLYLYNTGYGIRASSGLEIQSADYIRLLTSGANERMRIDSSGNVGIGNASPTHTLSVTGTLNVSGNANVGNIGATNGVFTNVSGSGAALTSLPAGNLTGTIPSGVLGNSSLFVGTTSIALNRSSANLALTGITSIAMPGSTSGTVTLQPAATAGTTTITLPATTGTVVTTGDSGTVTSTMIADATIVNADISASAAIAYSKLSLTGSIVNADISASAAIAYSKLSLTGSIVNADISASAAIAVSKLAASTISGITLGNNLNTLTLNTSGTGLSGSTTYNGSAAATFTVTSNATSANTASAIVARDASGNFSAGTITATFSGSGAALTSLPAGNLTGTIPSGVLGNSSHFIGTTSIALNRASANQSLTGITSLVMPGSTSGNVTLQPAATAGTTTITLPATTGTVVTTGDSGTVTSTMIADATIVNADISASAAIAVSKLAASTISGVTLGNNLNTLTLNTSGTGLSGSTTYNGSAAATFTVTSNATSANTGSAIVARDVNGDFNARYINVSYFNSTDDISTGTLTYLMGKFGDNYFRSATAAKVATFISGQTMNISGTATNITAYTINQSVGTGNAPTFAGLTATGRIIAQSSQASVIANATASLGGLECQGGGSTNAAFMTFHRPGAYAVYFGLDGTDLKVGGWSMGAVSYVMLNENNWTSYTSGKNVQLNSLGVGTAGSGTAGEIRATNNITAYYSDQRLKENIRLITNPLEKVSKISGVTFTQNSLAETFGYTDYSQQVGVIAQEIQAVLPEAVTAAPFDIAEDGTSKSGENYLTVRYEKLVPLLIEAIKELSAKVKELENK